jgi:hypothetical protein
VGAWRGTIDRYKGVIELAINSGVTNSDLIERRVNAAYHARRLNGRLKGHDRLPLALSG